MPVNETTIKNRHVMKCVCVRVCVFERKRCGSEGNKPTARMKFELSARGKVLEIEEPGQTYAQTH